MAAHVAALSGVLAAAAAASQASVAEAAAPSVQGDGAGTGDGAAAATDGFGNTMRVSLGGRCGCAPCWGPPAPPAMRPELLALFDAEEVAA